MEKDKGGRTKLAATENKQSEINGLDQRAQRITTWPFITGKSLTTRFAAREGHTNNSAQPGLCVTAMQVATAVTGLHAPSPLIKVGPPGAFYKHFYIAGFVLAPT